jgi:4-hydroxysphinganine ceramide fatty acyl 2-hydroxylase
MSKRLRIYTAEDVERHKTASSCWVIRGNKIYDVSTFLPDHPGGEDYILKYAGGKVENVMRDPDEHDHSDSAYEMLEEYIIGRLGNDDNIVREGRSNILHLYLLSVTAYILL